MSGVIPFMSGVIPFMSGVIPFMSGVILWDFYGFFVSVFSVT
ncbi:hypothetical protein [Treponema phagedenis]|nr:hypothetical protein [Treponema phagedenis]